MDGQSDLGNEYATMRLLQLSSQSGAELLPCMTSSRHRPTPDDALFPVEHIYESPDSVRRVPAPPPRAENIPGPGRNDPVWNPAAGVDVGGRYELPVGGQDQQRFTAVGSSIGNCSL